MPKKKKPKKPAEELTDEEVLDRLFTKRARERIKAEAERLRKGDDDHEK